MIRARSLTVRHPGAARAAVQDVSLDVARGEVVAIGGPNGSGKTTLLRALLGLMPVEQGDVELAGRPVRTWTRAGLAREVAVVAQREESVFPLRVREAVMLGRYPHLGPLQAEGPADRGAVQRALDRCDIADLAERRVDQLSGGEWQRVRLARALAQEPKALVLDEPTTSLDVRHEMELFELVAELARDGLAALVVTHGLNLAARFADRMLLMDRGRSAAFGAPADVLTEPVLSQVFRWPVAVFRWQGGAPQVVPLRRHEAPPSEESNTI
ncbi:MAG TPA: ABC transporter ATP-binding protein [Gemmatimonadales bacterium]|jgi:iron complex transport system ATP-binding protein|nr:ABC transporter ATP-binding protein [Gemmatimonadales bacterium]